MAATPTVSLPTWCKPQSWICHLPAKTIFQAVRCQRDRETGAIYLRDCNDREYLLSQCDQLKPEHFSGSALVISEGKALSAWLEDSDRIVLTDGHHSTAVLLPPIADSLAAARSLSEFFDGAIVDDPDNSTWNALKLGEGQ